MSKSLGKFRQNPKNWLVLNAPRGPARKGFRRCMLGQVGGDDCLRHTIRCQTTPVTFDLRTRTSRARQSP